MGLANNRIVFKKIWPEVYDTSRDVVMGDAFDTHYGNDVVMHDAFDTHYGDDTLMNPHPYKSDAWWHEEMMRDL